jgi:cob(I)alamin adenosyltransferase
MAGRMRPAILFCYDSSMAFFTGKGDEGTSKLFDSPQGQRITKTSPVFECLGMLDELNALIGWCKAACPDDLEANGRKVKLVLHDVQDHLFTIQAEVAGAEKSIPLTNVEHMGTFIKAIEASLPPVTSFLLAGGTELSARLDVARAVARRAERRLVTLHESGEREVSASSRAYANRLSSLLYALTRHANNRAGVEEEAPEYKS